MITLAIIIVTALISITAFNNGNLGNKLIFYPPAVAKGEWQRLFTYGVLHADFMHLIFNMFTLYLFGSYVEGVMKESLGVMHGSILYILMYITALPVSIYPTYLRHKNDTSYRGLGASGAVSAVVFAYVIFNPMSFMGIMFIPVWMPAFLFAILFIVISVMLDKKQAGGINHLAHIVGGIYGIVFIVVSFYFLANVNLLENFIQQIQINSLRDVIRFGY